MDCKHIAIAETKGCDVSALSNAESIVITNPMARRVTPPPAPTTLEDRALNAAVAYTRLLRARHPQWSPAKLQKKVGSHFNIKWI